MNSARSGTESGSSIGVVILAGGQGRRMWPFAEVRSKAALPVGGRPLLTWMLETVAEIDGIADIAVVPGFHPGSVDRGVGAGVGAAPRTQCCA